MERNITCKVCGAEFYHKQEGRGRPPTKCPTCRTVKAGAPKRRGRPPKKVVTVGTGEHVLVPVAGPIEAGDTVVRPLDMFKSRESAIKYATPFRVIAVTDTEALLDFEKNGAIVALEKLVKVALQGA